MKINQVENRTGITKKNIRFYEDEGLLSPRRNKGNGYREYDEEDVRTLEQIKLLRKLGLPLEEIRTMQSGKCTVADSMRRHLITLEREQGNLNQSVKFCNMLKSEEGILKDVDAESLLTQMEELEKGGTTFSNKHTEDIRRGNYIASVCIAFGIIFIMIVFFVLMLWTFVDQPGGAPPLPVEIIMLAVPVVVTGGIITALLQRIKEIRKGEAEDAKQY